MTKDIDTSGEKPESVDSDKKLIEESLARFELSIEAEQDIRNLALEDLKFRAGEQWDDQIKNDRSRQRRPCLVINKIPQFVQQITNEQRQNRPSIAVHPVDSTGDIETAKVIKGLIRHIESNSGADAAYDTAFEAAVTGGFGFFRVITDYVSPDSFDQEILIKRIPNSFSVRIDPYAVEPDGSDANWGFVAEDMPREEYKAKYPDSKLAQDGEWETVGNSIPGWMAPDSCRVVEYFYKKMTKKTVVMMSDGMVIEKKKLPKILPEGVSIFKEREAESPVIYWCKHNAVEILEKTEWPGKYIPIIPVYGQEMNIDGKRVLEGIVRNAKDPARMYNYWSSAQTEAIALAPRTPWIVAEGQIEGYEGQWATANTENQAYLPYKPTSVNGTPVPPPQRQSFEPAVQAITQARMMASDDIKGTTGIYDASMGARSNETSGVAIQRRNSQAQTSNYHFTDNLTRSIKHLGRILIDLIPKIYDTERSARIVGDDEVARMVELNKLYTDPETGEQLLYDLSAGRYDVTVDVGPSFSTKRQEAAASILDVTKSYPQLMQMAGDLLIKSMDWPLSQEIADRLKKMLPPQLQDKKGQPEIPPQVQQQMQQSQDMIKQLTEQLHAAHDERDQKTLELESKERIEMAKLETTATIELAKLESKEALNLLSHQIAELDQRTKLLNFDQPFPTEEQEEQGEQEEQSMPQAAEQSEGPEMGHPDAGEGMGQDPTGGETPGTPMEPMS